MAEPDGEPAQQGESTGRDPETGRFLPGVSGNPDGRPRGFDFHTLLREQLKGRNETMGTVFGEVMMGLRGAVAVPSSAAGAAKVLLDRICGPVIAHSEPPEVAPEEEFL